MKFSKRPQLYLANPLGFTELGQHELQTILSLLTLHFNVIEPFKQSQDLGQQLMDLKQSPLSIDEVKKQMSNLNDQIGKRNRETLDRCDVVVAILDHEDTGTAAEIGYAYARGIPIWGYFGDFRDLGDNLGASINLQVQYFIENSGGIVCRTLEELIQKLDVWLEKEWLPKHD